MSKYITPQVRNITKLFRSADLETIQAGADWYQDARRIVDTLADAHKVNADIVVGIIAALSPLNSWGNNVNLATRFLAAGGLNSGYLGAQLAKANAIYNLSDVSQESIETILGGDKTINFYRSIRSAGSEGVCIDRHAYALAVNTRYVEGAMPTLKGRRYAEVVGAYERAAAILSKEYDTPLTPAQVQSVTWVIWRRKFWSEGAFDKIAENV
jgi:hypothetical protein